MIADGIGAVAQDAVGAWRYALDSAGIAVPGSGVEVIPGGVADAPLVELGSVRPEVARQLAELIRAGATSGARVGVRRTGARPGSVLPLFPEPDPPPFPGCDICEALDRQRAEARARGDFSRVSDCNVEIRQHPHGTARG